MWWGSLPLRVVGTTLLASAIVLALGGWLLMQQATDGVLAGKRQASLAEASVAVETAQRQLRAADLSTGSSNDLLTQLTFEVANRGTLSGQYQVIVQGPVSDIRSGRVLPDSVPAELRARVAREGGNGQLWVTPTAVHYADGRPSEPGLAIGATVETSISARYPMYLIFPLTQERETLDVLQRAALTTGGLLTILLAIIAALVSRQVVAPIREARVQAEQIASGHLEDRMTVRGTDDLASLATSMNNMAGELHKQITQLEELSRVQQRFVSDVSHELRTPLTTVRMAAEVLHDGKDEFGPLEARSAELLHDELDRFESLLSDLLEISRFDAGAAELARETQDLLQVVRSEVEAQRAFAERNGIELRVHGDDPCTAEMDVRRVRRILRNLLSNAIEHGEARPIDVLVAGDDKAVAVAVRDHGVGFEASMVKQVFHRFWRADPARNRTVGGTGLGLSISMEDARLHGGWLNAWGRPGQGAQFRLTLPRTAGAVLEISPLPVIPRDLLESAERLAAERSAAERGAAERSATHQRADGGVPVPKELP
ncbi:MtrAB system histidine kinase MtrB [Enemella dayhoffiae]|uniref:MtrAB system histidine kinase MtrB n=1 Tax=Enemella dayhoffiae TaxID=2016507 RepID=UPI00226D11E9|nr:MtrAB system histidine kinase MtrB [Enemella dayhoffiae]